ncbi:hypothetical protein D7X87_24795 [bacterium D16-54]|nr:hypothetical protein D7X87_24795 [bacterium D16-54]RKJ09794.1 hypothetical protein D7X65_24650 [bacterium D16-56]
MRFRSKTKRAIALTAAAVLTATAILPHMYLTPHAAKCKYGNESQHEWTGLKLYWTDIPAATGGNLRWPRKTYFDGGTGIYKGMDNSYCFCVANHTGQAGMGDEGYLEEGAGALLVQDYALFKGNKDVFYEGDVDRMKRFTFCLAAAAANYPGQRSDSELKSGIQGTYIYAMATSVFLAIEGRLQTDPKNPATKIVISTEDKEAARTAYHQAMEQEFFLYPHANQNKDGEICEIDSTIKQQLLANRDAFFDEVWDAAIIMCDAIGTDGTQPVANRVNCVQDPTNPMNYIVTVDCHKQESLWTKYYSKLKAVTPSGCTKISSSYDAASGMGTLVFEVPSGGPGVSATEGPTFQFEDSTFLTDLSKPVLYQFQFCGDDCGNYQTLFCAMHEVPTFSADPGNPPPPPPPGEGSIELEIHRYKHTETWKSTYNVDLIKLDSETGKPLEGSQWDILEYDTLGQWDEAGTQLGDTYLDHPVSEAGNIGTKYNWANDGGTQFTRWEDEDACDRDLNVTGEDGYLYEANSLGSRIDTKAHADVYNYTYTKGYCTGHPKPVVQYIECDHDEEDDCDCEERNAELDRIAEEAWQEQVDYCEKLAAEGGFFHTAEESISDTAKKQLEEDRDQFYKDFISLTYDYSAEEVAARNGYIRHDLHTDDIPVERVVIHCSEYLDEIAGGGSSGSGVVDKEDEEMKNPGSLGEEDEELDQGQDSGTGDRRAMKKGGLMNADNGAGSIIAEESSTEAAAETIEAAKETMEAVQETTEAAPADSTAAPEQEAELERSASTKNLVRSSLQPFSRTGADEAEEDDGEEALRESVPAESREAEGEPPKTEESPRGEQEDEEQEQGSSTGTTLEAEDTGKDGDPIEPAVPGKPAAPDGDKNTGSAEKTENAGKTEGTKDDRNTDVTGDSTEEDAADKETKPRETLSPEEDPEQNIELDFELIDGEMEATASDAATDEGRPERKPFFDVLWEKALSAFGNPDTGRMARRAARAADDDEEGGGAGGGYARNDAQPPKHGSPVTYIGAINFEKSEVTPHTQGRSDMECWTFIVYDHRTEGEIHFNKRDLDLQNDEGTLFDAYMRENADGTLEGAVYGLFALTDIIHPDSNQTAGNDQDTGLVYQAGDLVSVASTDRNGDGSFMVFTEAPGMVYDYASGAIVKRTDKPWDGPSNLHTEEVKADAAVQDNEKFYGWDAEGANEVTLTDSEVGDGTFYWKHSSNQGLNKGEGQDEGTMYPILDNENNNGNCWIGRPLIVSGKNTARYYIRELSRSEGYELSVYGKDMELTNRNAPEDGSMAVEGSVSIGQMMLENKGEGDDITRVNTVTITAVDTTGGFDVTFKNLSEVGNEASFFLIGEKLVQKEEPVTGLVKKKYPVMAQAGTPVLINGQRVEAEAGDTINLPNGTTATVQETITYSGDYYYIPVRQSAVFLPNADRYNNAAGANFIAKYNEALLGKRIGVPLANAPWILVPKGSSDAESFTNMTQALQDYTGFNQMRVVADLGDAYAVQYSHSSGKDSIYDTNNQILWVKKDVSIDGEAGFVYARYDAGSLDHDDYGFMLNNQKPDQETIQKYEDLSSLTFHDADGGTYWVYTDGDQLLEDDGTPAYYEKTEEVPNGTVTVDVIEEELTPVDAGNISYNAGTNTYTVHFDGPGTYKVRIIYQQEDTGMISTAEYAKRYAAINSHISAKTTGTYIEEVQLSYPGDQEILEDAGTIGNPTKVFERPIRQKVRIEKDIQTLPETKQVWYCLNCGYENQDGVTACGFCNRARSTEETRSIDYAHDTYAAVHSDNISAERDGGWYETAKDWLGSLLKGNSPEEEPESIGNFRFKAYLKSNLERLYRDEDGHVVWMDRNGNTMTPQYEDTNGDGNYDTFTWKYDTAYGGKTVDFPEKDKVSGDGISDTLAEDAVLLSSNVQKIYTDVEHRTKSMTTSARANNLWDTYADPQDGKRENAGQIEGYTTSERETRSEGDAVVTNASLYSYDGILRDRNRTDYLQDEQNHGYTRLLETQRIQIEDGTELINHEAYNYEKFFDAIRAANTDIWDNDMHSTFTGSSMSNYPGQHWFETFYEKYQLDDTDKDYTLANTDGADKDGTAGGDRDTSFKPFRWIREHVFGDRDGYIQYPAVNNGENMEVVVNTSDQARANANASDAVRQFAVKWYLEDEAAKLMVDNGLGENIAKPDGKIGYDEAVYDMALFEAIAKAYNYLRPFYYYDLDTIYSVEWDSAPGGGADKDYTTLSADERLDDRYYNISSYLPYGVYVIVEQPPMRRDDAVNDWKNRSFDIEKPKEVIVPSVYDGPESNNTTDNYHTHYNFDAAQLLTNQARQENYLLRFGEENSANTSNQDDREFVIRAHGYHGDFEVYKYGLDIDRLQASIAAPNGDYSYGGWDITQEEHDPLKDYYENDHRGEEGVEEIRKENGGNDASRYHGFDTDVTANGNGAATANGTNYNGEALRKRFFYGSIAEDDGVADQVLFKDGAVDENNASGMSWHNGVKSTTGELTAYDGKYSAALVPWTMTAPADSHVYSAEEFSGYADVNERNRFYTTMLRINKTDSETGEYIVHDDAIFGIYAASRYNSFAEIEEDSKLIEDPDERAKFLMQFKPGDAKFYLQDTVIMGSREFLEAMKARDLTPFRRRTALNESMEDPGHLYSGIVPKGTPVCIESERIDLYDGFGDRTGQMTVWSTRADIKMDDPETQNRLEYGGQNVGYFKTSQPIGAGVYVLAEIKPPDGYVRSKPVAIEVYSDRTTYYADGDMYAKVDAVRYEANLLDEYPYK